ncbi:hypothetical protein HAX54_049945, partial [Datura stramonium]|nr:hypothetical protein [Datura stramonium]
ENVGINLEWGKKEGSEHWDNFAYISRRKKSSFYGWRRAPEGSALAGAQLQGKILAKQKGYLESVITGLLSHGYQARALHTAISFVSTPLIRGLKARAQCVEVDVQLE